MLMWDSKLSQRKLAPQLGMTQANLSKKVRGERGWSVDDLLAVSRFFDVSVSYLVGETENRRPDDPNGGSDFVVRPPGLEPGTH
ncbi:helix-turn-helix domain-containing protein [Brevibacterium sanguinis]|uniref:helix-turn-helix domain-containing protein n=1 Tax=Brevibacterium sanguinis TaxID=232444 RepID=UPI003CD06502